MSQLKAGVLHWFVDPSGANKPPLGFIYRSRRMLIVGGPTGTHEIGTPKGLQAELRAIQSQGYVLAAQARAGGLIDPSWSPPELPPKDAALVKKLRT
jgi:hypothetical protein